MPKGTDDFSIAVIVSAFIVRPNRTLCRKALMPGMKHTFFQGCFSGPNRTPCRKALKTLLLWGENP